MTPRVHRRGTSVFSPFVLLLALGACQRPAPAPSTQVAQVTRRDLVVSAIAAGVVEPITTVEVKSKASGEIVEVLVQEGDEVRQGQLLVRVDPRIPTNAVAQAEADSVVARAELDNAEAQLARATTLYESQAITALEHEGAKLSRATAYAALIRARRALEDAKIALEDTEVRAPDNGIILGRTVEVGSVIASASRDVGGGAVLLRMATLDTVQVRALVDETDIGMIEPDLDVTIQVAAFPNRPFTGRVERIGTEAVAQQNVTMFPVLVRIGNRERLLRPGMNAEVEVHIGEVENALVVPNAALRTPEDARVVAEALGLPPEEPGMAGVSGNRAGVVARTRDTGPRGAPPVAPSPNRRNPVFGGDYIVFALRDGTPSPIRVQTGLTDFDYTVIRSGLVEGDTVLVLPTAGLLEEQARREEWARSRAGSPLGTRP